MKDWKFGIPVKASVGGQAYLSNVNIYGREYPIYGYPTSSGQAYQIYPGPSCCGIYAGSENKEGAWEFVESLLGEAHQKRQSGANPGFPIRASVLKELEAEGVTLGSGDKAATTTESEFLIIEDIFYHGEFVRGFLDANIWNVVQEEAASYFAGDKSAEEVAHIIQNRVGIILNE